jgi:quercetin dioxygenase-like cupin family protein
MNIRIPSVLLLATLGGLSAPALAHGPGSGDGEEKITMLQERPLADAPGKKALAFTVDYAPGQRSIPHVHTGSAIAYVLEGSVTSQLEGEAPVTYRAGESWYESPRINHLVSQNASATRPAKLLVWILNDGDAPLLTPLSSNTNAGTKK